METRNPEFDRFAKEVENAVKSLREAGQLADSALHRPEINFEKFAVVLDEVANCARAQLMGKAYQTLSRISVRTKSNKPRTSSTEKLRAAKESGRKGGLAKSHAKTLAARANARLPRLSRLGSPSEMDAGGCRHE